eukprot:9026432-Ditylum_brightwellii.AAC.1
MKTRAKTRAEAEKSAENRTDAISIKRVGVPVNKAHTTDPSRVDDTEPRPSDKGTALHIPHASSTGCSGGESGGKSGGDLPLPPLIATGRSPLGGGGGELPSPGRGGGGG